MVSFEAPANSLSCFGTCCKWLLYLCNILIMASGLGAIAVGVWAVTDDTSNRTVVLVGTDMYVIAAKVLIAGGTTAFLASILGCCSARYENRCLITIYAVALVLIFVTEFASGIVALAFYTQMEYFANIEMRDGVRIKYGMPTHYEMTDAFNYFQNNFDCCGFEGDGHEAAQLYQISKWFHTSLIQVPASCCKRDEDGEPLNLLKCQSQLKHDQTFVNNIGCKKAVMEQAGMFSVGIAGAGVGLSMLEIIALVLTCCLVRQL